ncbi:hypothetical protein SAMN05444397_11166 [Flavobacterium aquidurense]|nr:hypothetical protein SAMN05444397_11166 [Flavobacterium aquidurense]
MVNNDLPITHLATTKRITGSKGKTNKYSATFLF